jgi:UPF0755 protein
MKKKKNNNEMVGRVFGLTGNVLDTILQILLIVVIVLVIIKGAGVAYDYGYRVFTEEPMAKTIGKEIEVTIPVDFSAMDLGKLFESKGLTRDPKLLALQYYCSEYRENVKGGTYTLSTTMTAEEMFEAIAEVNIEKAQAAKEAEEKLKAEEEAAAKAEAEAKEKAESDDGDMSGEGDTGIQQIDMGDDSGLTEDSIR